MRRRVAAPRATGTRDRGVCGGGGGGGGGSGGGGSSSGLTPPRFLSPLWPRHRHHHTHGTRASPIYMPPRFSPAAGCRLPGPQRQRPRPPDDGARLHLSECTCCLEVGACRCVRGGPRPTPRRMLTRHRHSSVLQSRHLFGGCGCAVGALQSSVGTRSDLHRKVRAAAATLAATGLRQARTTTRNGAPVVGESRGRHRREGGSLHTRRRHFVGRCGGEWHRTSFGVKSVSAFAL